MKKNTLKFLVMMVFLFVFSWSNMNAQAMIKEVALKQQIENSALLIEGEVMAKESFWDQEHQNIYTVNTIKVRKVFKGESVSTVEVITLGGVVGLKAEIVTPSLRLNKHEIGVFMLNENTTIELLSESKGNQFKPFSGSQGFYKYNVKRDVVSNPFNRKTGITSTFYNEIMAITNSNYIEITNSNINKKQLASKQSRAGLVPVGITFSPTTLAAGVKDILTINGSNFGATKGKVGFSMADDGGVSFIEAIDTQVLSWSDTQIIVEVPSGAGTGPIQVTDSANDSAVSSTVLTVSFSEINIVSNQAPSGPNSGMDVAYSTRHMDDNNSGGYTWQMFTGFDANAAAKSSFLRAFETWRCETGVNWEVGATTNIDVNAADGVSVIRFDVGNELGANVLGRCTSRYSGCLINGNTAIDWFVEELDLVFNDSVDNSNSSDFEETWNFGPGASTGAQYDFESVALHELGHGHQLGHVIDSNNDVMHYVLFNGQDERDLGSNNIVAGNSVQSRSVAGGVCGFLAMTNYAGSCGLGVESIESSTGVTMYPNPAKQQLFIKNQSSVSLERVEIYDVSGRLVSNIDVSGGTRTKTIHLLNVSKGMYFVNIYSENDSITKKLIVE